MSLCLVRTVLILGSKSENVVKKYSFSSKDFDQLPVFTSLLVFAIFSDLTKGFLAEIGGLGQRFDQKNGKSAQFLWITL